MKSSQDDGHHVTQYCPVCGYDLWGLIQERCPECGTPFDRSELRWVRKRPRKVSPWVDLFLVGSLLLGAVRYNLPPSSRWRFWFDLAWLILMAVLAASWAWLQRDRLLHDRPHWLLWLALVMIMMANHPPLLNWGGAATAALLASAGLLAYVVYKQPGKSMRLGATGLVVFGAALVALGMLRILSGGQGHTLTVFGWSVSGGVAGPVFVTCLGAVCSAVGAAAAILLRKQSKGSRSGS